MRKRKYSLSIHITSLFLILTTLVGAVLIAISYRHAQELLAGSAKELSEENSRQLESTFQLNTGPILTTLDFMALSEVVERNKKPHKEVRFLTSLNLIFKRSPGLVALYYGNEKGELALFRPLRTNAERERFGAPSKATLMINQTYVSGANIFYFLDGNYKVLDYNKTNGNEFDPRVRPWFKNASNDGEVRLTEPYFFYFLQTNGVTFSRRSADGKSVVGADFTLNSLSEQIAQLGYSDTSKLVLFDNQFNVLAHYQGDLTLSDNQQENRTQIENSLFSKVLGRMSSQILYEKATENDLDWSITLTPVNLNKHTRILLAEATPQDDLLANLLSMRDKQLKVAFTLMVMSFFIVWIVAKRLANPLQNLMHQTDSIARFDFKKTRYSKSVIKEVANLTTSIELMEHTLHDLLRLLRETASNQDFSVLAKTITHQSYLVTRAETIVLYTKDSAEGDYEVSANHAIIPFKIDINEFLQSTAWIQKDLAKGEVLHFNRNDNTVAKYRDTLYNSDVYLFPLINRSEELVGILLLGYERAITQEQSDKHAFLRELLSFAELAKENIDKIRQQKEMLNAFVELIASAIDTKSPYTGSHCQRVPKLSKLLTQAACEDKQYFANFSMDDSEWEALHLASWLHDCGKVTTPEYVIDKATKLETIYDRIHEVRMRFELLKAQAEIDYLKQVNREGDSKQLKHALTERQQKLDEDFAFIAHCNIGGEFMDDESIERIKTISQYQWRRTIDDQLGVSRVEQQRAGKRHELPIMESILSDKEVHKVPWPQNINPKDVWQEKFVLQPGQLKYNRGEVYNLSIRRGTLNDEERFMINDHIIQTITMLNRLPYPEHLKNVPEIAGGHHERIDGLGYPRGLYEEDLSIPARIMAIADVFEALTSSDRPYKKAKNLSESLNIMTEMATSGHIDPKLYLLFLENKIDKQYATLFLAEDQICEINRDDHIRKVKTFLKSHF
ncbi:adenylate cyclase [Vibrio orientalis CIP 102891 = ATCC 33934]|uniref:Adenylate cyclase n=1 Tax=Vibrio orientalis CIP 102891 = ATCC 33934 TaxID=675816 RepID=C9QGU7_VIBOR|nr:HD domain-containing phosphohydrolase [Vibrio orientalis]EEX93873.1 chemotactic transducer-related protein [Vibrio orientalis CIP 102891 = ATCC 33934]EGU48324.1 adenylate cyclase [Vibrio orientalis CIP 102891 = ATCC 33934]